MKYTRSDQHHRKEKLIIDEFLPYLLGHASNIVSRQIDEIASTKKMSRNKCKVLLTLIDSEGVTLNELADLMIIKQPTLSRIVETMVNAGWLERRVMARDRRTVNICLTQLGLNQAQPLIAHARKMDAIIETNMGIASSNQLKKLLSQLITIHNTQPSS
jgi:DNA-binding MarR family transcriptional regulator